MTSFKKFTFELNQIPQHAHVEKTLFLLASCFWGPIGLVLGFHIGLFAISFGVVIPLLGIPFLNLLLAFLVVEALLFAIFFGFRHQLITDSVSTNHRD